jgi:hypothetical protein
VPSTRRSPRVRRLIRLDIQTKGRQEDAGTVRHAADAAARELSAFGSACRTTAGPSRVGVERAMATLRGTARPNAQPGTAPDPTG